MIRFGTRVRGKDLYKRGLYIHFQRTTPYPFLQNFDAPDASTPACRRGRSNTPLQALNLLNDPVFFEAAQFLALRILKKLPAASFHDRLDYGFRLCLGRPPSANESEVMLSYLTRQKVILEKEPESVTELLPVGYGRRRIKQKRRPGSPSAGCCLIWTNF